MSNIIRLKIVDDPNLEKIPKKLTNLRNIDIWFFGKKGTPHSNKRLYHLHSLKDLPQKLPSLESIEFHNSIIHNLEDLTAQMPKLQSIYLGECHIHNFRGFPTNTTISIQDSTIDSFEGLELPIPHNENESLIYFKNCIIHSLACASNPTLHAILIQFPKYRFPTKNYVYYYKDKYYEFDNEVNRLKQLKEIVYNEDKSPLSPNMPPQAHMKTLINFSINFLNVPKTAMELIEHTKNPRPDPEISGQNDLRWFITNFPHLNETDYDSQRMCREWGITFDEDVYFEQEHTIIFPEDILFPDKLEILYQYYRKPARQLAQEYITAPKSLPPDQIERLIHEIDPQLRNLLENNLPPSDPLIKQMSAKFAFKMENGLKILK